MCGILAVRRSIKVVVEDGTGDDDDDLDDDDLDDDDLDDDDDDDVDDDDALDERRLEDITRCCFVGYVFFFAYTKRAARLKFITHDIECM
jgi:hypothetical protein